MSRSRRRTHAAVTRSRATVLPSDKSPSKQAAEDVATVAVGAGLLGFACIGCVGAVLGAFSVGSFLAALISPWTLLAAPVVAYALWRWQRYRLECRIDPSQGRRSADRMAR